MLACMGLMAAAALDSAIDAQGRNPYILPMSTAAECRQNAAECIRLAKLARSVEQKNILCEMAQTLGGLGPSCRAAGKKTETKNKKPNAA